VAEGGEGRVALEVFDARGRRVRTLLQNRVVSGSLDVEWDGRDDQGHSVPSGVYFCRLTAPEGATTRRMTLVR
jgi:flagellar hook assembly protein FlgD